MNQTRKLATFVALVCIAPVIVPLHGDIAGGDSPCPDNRAAPATPAVTVRVVSRRKTMKTDVREEIARVLPDAFATAITGYARSGERPLWKRGPIAQIVLATTYVVGGVMLSITGLALGNWWLALLIPGWLMTVGGSRKFQVELVHQAAHERLTGHKKFDRAFGRAVTSLFLIQEFAAYIADHVGIHHTQDIATEVDSDFKFLRYFGIEPGVPKRELWRRLRAALVSPRFHVTFLRARLASHWNAVPGPKKDHREHFFVHYRRPAMISVLVLLGIALVLAPMTTIMAWIIPTTILYQMSALLQFSSEHKWMRIPGPDEDQLTRYARVSIGRFCGEAPPPRGLRGPAWVTAWSRWWSRMLFIHLPTRMCVLVGDLPAHDHHHRHPGTKDWPNAAHARRVDAERADSRWPPYEDIWGLATAIDRVFDEFSKMPPLATPSDMTRADTDNVLGGM